MHNCYYSFQSALSEAQNDVVQAVERTLIESWSHDEAQ